MTAERREYPATRSGGFFLLPFTRRGRDSGRCFRHSRDNSTPTEWIGAKGNEGKIGGVGCRLPHAIYVAQYLELDEGRPAEPHRAAGRARRKTGEKAAYAQPLAGERLPCSSCQYQGAGRHR